jgi:peptide-methionine (R)-S-oxide reductase
VLRNKGTEPPRTGKYDKFFDKGGEFVCAGCGTPLYTADSKFK